MAKLKGMRATVPITKRTHHGDPLAPEDIQPTEGKTEVWVGGRLVGEITERGGPKTEDLIFPGYRSQEEANEEREAAEARSKQAAAAARKSKKEVEKMARG